MKVQEAITLEIIWARRSRFSASSKTDRLRYYLLPLDEGVMTKW